MNQESSFSTFPSGPPRGTPSFFSPFLRGRLRGGRGRVITGAAILTAIVLILFYFFGPGKEYQATIIKINGAKIRVEIADDLPEQIQGLSGRDALCGSCGMLFVYDKPQILTFWMKDMKFALDIVFIRDGRIAEIYESVPPPNQTDSIPKVVTSGEPADMVLEVNGGFTRDNGLENGDQLVLQ